MCVVCVLLDKDKITKKEALKALWEQITQVKTSEEKEHVRDLYAELEKDLFDLRQKS